ncbi:MAG: hypothetical protein QW303_05500 [Nitrososphaerota archaeon]
MKREIKDYIIDIIDSMNKAIKFIEGCLMNNLFKMIKQFFVVVRALEIIGEAIKNIYKIKRI